MFTHRPRASPAASFSSIPQRLLALSQRSSSFLPYTAGPRGSRCLHTSRSLHHPTLALQRLTSHCPFTSFHRPSCLHSMSSSRQLPALVVLYRPFSSSRSFSSSSSSSSSDPSSSSNGFSASSTSSSRAQSLPSDTIPVTSDGNLDAELGEAMATTGADLSTPAHHISQPTDPSNTLTALEINSSGHHTERDYSPLQLARRFGLHPRDMRFLDSSLRNLPSLLVRREVIIVNLELFKAIISAKEVLLFDPWYPHIQSIVPLMKHALTAFGKKGADGEDKEENKETSDASPSTATSSTSTTAEPTRTSPSSSSPSSSSPPSSSSSSSSLPSSLPRSASSGPPPHGPSVREMASDLESVFRDRSLFGLRDHEREYEEWMEPRMPFEFIALELILMTVTRTLESRFEVYNSSLSPLLSSSSTTLNEGSTLMHLLQLKNGLTSFEVVLTETGQAIKQVLQDDKDMLDMFLTMKMRGQVPRIEEHGEIEVLLETYLRKVDELENEVRTNVKSISLTEEHIQIRLDTVRNAMMKVDLLVTICTFGVATAALIASTFGMNLRSHLEDSASAFYVTSVAMTVLCVMLIGVGLRLCRKHKIDLFHVEPEVPKLWLPVNGLKKYKRRSSPVHRMKGRKEEEGEEGSGERYGAGGIFDKDEWSSQTLDYKLAKLEKMKQKQEWMWRTRADRPGGREDR